MRYPLGKRITAHSEAMRSALSLGQGAIFLVIYEFDLYDLSGGILMAHPSQIAVTPVSVAFQLTTYMKAMKCHPFTPHVTLRSIQFCT